MTMSSELSDDFNRHQAALDIVDPGACNPSGVALAIHNICRDVIAGNGNQRTDEDVRLAVTQLSYLVSASADLDPAEYRCLVEACRARAAERRNAART